MRLHYDRTRKGFLCFFFHKLDKKIITKMIFIIFMQITEIIVFISLPMLFFNIKAIKSFEMLIFILLLLLNIMLAFTIPMAKSDIEPRITEYKNTILLELFTIKYYTPYQIMESSDYSRDFHNAKKALESNVFGLEAFINSFFDICINISVTLVTIIFLNVITDLMNLFSIVFVLIIGIAIILKLIKRNRNYYDKYLENDRLVNKQFFVGTTPKSIKEFKVSNSSEWFTKRYKKSCNNRNNNYQSYMKNNLLIEVLMLVILGVIGITILQSVLHKNFGIGELTSMIIALISLLLSIEPLFKSFVDTLVHKNETVKLKEFMEKYKGDNVKHSSKSNDVQKMVLDKIAFRYNGCETEVLKNLSFVLEKGDKVAVIGKNGAGKSTLMKILAGLYTPSFGEYYILDKENKRNTISINDVSLMPQDFSIYPYTIIENITMKNSIQDFELEKINQIIDDLNLSHIPKNKKVSKDIDNDGIELSGGEKQKISIARTIYQNRPIIILDEPTAALDPLAEKEIYELCDKWFADKICFFVSHRLGSTSFCNYVLFYDEKNIILDKHEYLLETNKAYHEMYFAQKDFYEKDSVRGGI